MGDVLPPKRQTVVERLKRRFDLYRRHQNSCLPRYEQAENNLYEAQRQDTLLLKQRFLESKAKKAKSNKSDHHRTYKESVTDGGKSQTHPKPIKRPAEEPLPNPSDCANGEDEKPSKISRTDITQEKLSDIKTKQQQPLPSFSVQIVQQFSKAPLNQKSQTIQTNVTVQTLSKPLTSSPVPQTSSINPKQETVCIPQDNQHSSIQIGTVECKQEKVDCLQTDFCQFKGVQSTNSDRLSDTFPSLGFTDDSTDDVIHPDILKDLIDDVFTNSADIMKDFNFDDSVGSMKDQEDPTKDIIGDLIKETSLRPFQADNLSFVNTSINMQHQQLQQQQLQHQHQQQLQQQHLQQQQQNGIYNDLSSDDCEAPVVPITSIVTTTSNPPTTVSNFYNAATQRLPSYGSSSLSIPNGLSLDFKLEPSPAALTLKQMAEQHQSMQQKQQQQQQFVNSPLANRPSPFSQDAFTSHMNPLRSANSYLPGTNPSLQSSSPKTPNSNNMFNAFDRQMNNINRHEQQILNNLPAGGQNLNNLPSNNQALSNLPTSNQSLNNLPISNQPLNNMPTNNQTLNNMPISPNTIFETDIHSRSPNVMPEMDRAKQPNCQTIQQKQQQQKPPAYVSTRPLTHYTENPQMRLQSPVGNQHQRPMGRQFQNNMQIAQAPQMHASQGHHNAQQLQPNTHDRKPQQHHLIHQSHSNPYVSFPSQQPGGNPTFHVTMSQSISYSPQFTSSQTLNRPPPEYKAHHPNLPVDNVNLIEQLSTPSHVVFNNPSKNNKFVRHQKPPNVTITPDGTAISSSSSMNWRHLMSEQQQNNQYKISNFQDSFGNFVRNEQAAVPPQLFSQYRMPSNQMTSTRMIRPNVVPNQMLLQQRQRVAAPQQRPRNPSEMEHHSNMVMTNSVLSGLSSGYSSHQDMSRTDGHQINLDFLDNIESSASDLLNFDQVMQGSGTHFPLLDDMEILGK